MLDKKNCSREKYKSKQKATFYVDVAAFQFLSVLVKIGYAKNSRVMRTTPLSMKFLKNFS